MEDVVSRFLITDNWPAPAPSSAAIRQIVWETPCKDRMEEISNEFLLQRRQWAGSSFLTLTFLFQVSGVSVSAQAHLTPLPVPVTTSSLSSSAADKQ